MTDPTTPIVMDAVLLDDLCETEVTVVVTVENDDDEMSRIVDGIVDDELLDVARFFTLTASPLTIRKPLPASQQAVLSGPCPQQ